MRSSRRRFLGLAASGLAWSLSPALRGAHAAPLRLGFSLYGMKTLPLDRALGDRKSTRLNSSHEWISRMPSSA